MIVTSPLVTGCFSLIYQLKQSQSVSYLLTQILLACSKYVLIAHQSTKAMPFDLHTRQNLCKSLLHTLLRAGHPSSPGYPTQLVSG